LCVDVHDVENATGTDAHADVIDGEVGGGDGETEAGFFFDEERDVEAVLLEESGIEGS
jgi:hypothetical protein